MCGLPVIPDKYPVTAFLVKLWTTLPENTYKFVLYFQFLYFILFIYFLNVKIFIGRQVLKGKAGMDKVTHVKVGGKGGKIGFKMLHPQYNSKKRSVRQ